MDKIIGMGNALVDALVHIESDSVLDAMNLPKGSMQLIDERRFDEVSRKIAELNPSRAAGGSASNAMLALANLGRTTGFIGKVGNDEYGWFLFRYFDCRRSECRFPTYGNAHGSCLHFHFA